jgi:phage gp45-like
MIKVKIISVTDDDYQKLFTAIGRGNEEFNNRSYFQHAGFTSIPKVNTVGIVFEEGNTYTMVATADPLADRPTLTNEKDVAIYADANKYIKISADGTIEVSNGNGNITMSASGDVDINNGNLTVDL